MHIEYKYEADGAYTSLALADRTPVEVSIPEKLLKQVIGTPLSKRNPFSEQFWINLIGFFPEYTDKQSLINTIITNWDKVKKGRARSSESFEFSWDVLVREDATVSVERRLRYSGTTRVTQSMIEDMFVEYDPEVHDAEDYMRNYFCDYARDNYYIGNYEVEDEEVVWEAYDVDDSEITDVELTDTPDAEELYESY